MTNRNFPPTTCASRSPARAETFRSVLIALATLCAALAACVNARAATDASDFFAGKTVTLVVGSAAGTGYDTYARLMSRFLPQHIPSHPNIIVENIPGVSGLKAAYYLYNVAVADGTVIALGESTLPIAPLLTPSSAQFDVNRFSWIGSATKDTYVTYLWHTAPAKTFEDAKKMDVVLGGISAGSPSVNLAVISNALFNTRFKIISGYNSTAEMNLAMQRGEIQGTFVNTYSALKSQQPTWIKDGTIRVILQLGLDKNRDFPNVPQFIDQATNEGQRRMLEFVLAPQETAKPFFAPPQLPPERLEVLRRAFDATVADPAFLAAAHQAGIEVSEPMNGEALAEFVKRVAATPRSAVDALNKILANATLGR